jgi:D-glycero-alpha-D-manno-heptose-7-phosphate kinase
MILAKAPLRISFMGGGSDLPNFYEREFGEVISCTINKYVYVVFNTPFDSKIRLSYSKTEVISSVSEINHRLFRETLLEMGIKERIEIGSFADVPDTGTGLGSSSTFTVALVAGLAKMQNLDISSERIAEIACKIEMERCKDPIGKQDQYTSALGGLNKLRFNSDGSVAAFKQNLNLDMLTTLENSLYLIFLNSTRSSNIILKTQSTLLRTNSQVFANTEKLRDMVDAMMQAIASSDIKLIGRLLEESWRIKQQLSVGVSNSQIDEAYVNLKAWGATGGKLLGAGGGGFLLMAVPSPEQERFDELLAQSSYRKIDFKFVTDGVKTYTL